ncbi:MAG: hypothetical protein QGH08_00340 [Arenicellales bacterium]|jgi:hypothetical protein|nr:hypothetical protein [Arenicellales bacterium]MDP7063469.1 hypothetical protein [Arenicellales bacterium]|tara:strand:+ start:613 stop:903 length:291 start_codon:yes stop_codon:yes gene_type:complete
MRKMSTVRYKPKPECYDEFLEALQTLQNERATAVLPAAWTLKNNYEIIRVVTRSLEEFSPDLSNTNWLDTVRHLIQEFNEVGRHAIPFTGDIVQVQ